MPKFKEPEVKA